MELTMGKKNDIPAESSPLSLSSRRLQIVFWALGLTLLVSLNIAVLLFITPLKNHVSRTGNHRITTIDWIVQEATYTRVCKTKKILTVNGMFPGPALHLQRGQRVKVNVHNQGSYGVTIHWHGVKQPRNPWSDGTQFITQCNINPGSNYTYEIILSDEEGTLWWHAHSDWTRATVHGPIFIYPPNGRNYPFRKPYKEIPIMLGSWFEEDVMKDLEELLATGGDANKPVAFTINGQPGDSNPCSARDMFRLSVEYEKTYLLRIVNALVDKEIFFMVANHNLTLVGMDASYTKPISINYIMITPGQTMDVLLTTDQNISQNYYMAARSYSALSYPNTNTSALIQYTNNPIKFSFPILPDVSDSAAAIAFTSQLKSLNSKEYPTNVPEIVQRRIIMTVSLGTLPCEVGNNCTGMFDNRFAASLNNITFPFPQMDVLQAYYKNIDGVYKSDFPDRPENVFNYTEDPMSYSLDMRDINGTRVVEIDYGTNVEIVFQGTNVMNAAENHPMHLHGYSFYQVGWGLGNFNESTDPEKYNLKDPPLINTIGVPKNGWTSIRFTANNPGVWFMHCHLDKHSSWGMDTALIVKNGPTPETSIRSPDYIIPCYNSTIFFTDEFVHKERRELSLVGK